MADSDKKTTGSVNLQGAVLKEESQQTATDPFSPTNTGLPVIIKDSSGNRIGNVWSPSQAGLGDALKSVEKGESTKLYLDLKTSNFTNYPSSTMSYKDGKINLNVASDVANSDWYKKIVNSDQFKQLAALYKQDPTGKTELEISSENDAGETTKKKKTINALLEEYANQIADTAKKYQANIDTRTNMSRLTGGALNLTDDDLVFMSNYRNFNKQSYSNSDVAFLPDSVKDFFKDYETYDEESGSISAGDWYKNFYYLDSELPESAKEIIEVLGGGELGDDNEALRGVQESEKDYAIDLVRLRVSQEMNEIVERLTFYKDDLSAEEKAYYATEYAKCFSLYKTMTQDAPGSDSWTGFNLAVQNIATGAGDQIITASEGILNLLSGAAYVTGASVAGTFAAIDGVFGFLSNIITSFFEGGIEKVDENFVSLADKVQESVSGVLGEGTPLGEMKQSIQETGKAISERKDLAAQLFESAEYEMGLVYANAEAMQRVGRLAGFILTQIIITNPVGSAVGNAVAPVVANATSLFTTGYTLTEMAGVIGAMASSATTAAAAVKYLGLLNKISNVGRLAGFAANVYAQGVVDTFVENPALTDALIFGASEKEVAEFQNALRANVVWNAVGEFAPFMGKGARKGLKFVSTNTRIGAVTQGVLRKVINRLTLRGRKVYEGLSEFMTRKVPEEIIEQTDATSTATRKLSSVKRWQALRKEIIAIQEEIKDAKIFRGEGTWTENAKAIDELIDKRIELETKLGITKKIAIAEAKNRIIKNAGLEIEVTELAEQTAELTTLSKKMKQTNLPGSFSKQTGDYINDLYHKQLLDAKSKAFEAAGKALSKEEQGAYQILQDRIAKYEASLPAAQAEAYKGAARSYLEANYRFYEKLRAFLASDAGGNILTQEEAARMAAGQYGARYMQVFAVGGYKGATTIEDLLSNPSKVVNQGKMTVEDIRFNRAMFSDEVTYADPNYVRDLALNRYAELSNGITAQEAVVRAGRATSIQTDSNGRILKTSNDITNAKNKLYKDLEKLFSGSLQENTERLGRVTAESTKNSAKRFWSKAKRSAQRSINEILGLDTRGLKTYASTLNSKEIAQIANVYSMPAYSRRIRIVADLNAMYDSLSPAQKKIVDTALKGEPLSLRGWNDAVTNNNLDVKLSRQYVKDNNGILRSKFYKDLVAKAREESLNEEETLALKESKLKLEEAETKIASGKEGVKEAEKQLQKGFKKTVGRTITEAVDAIADALIGSDNPYLEALLKEYEKAGVSSDLAKQYIVYQWMYDNIGKGGLIQHIAFDYYNAPAKVSEIRASTDTAKGFAKNFRDAAESVVESKLNKTIAQVQEEGVEGLVDMESTIARTDKYLADISDMYAKHNIIEAWDRETGKFVYYKVDRSTYNLVTNYPTFQKNNLATRTLARINSIARIGQITVRAASLVTQGFKDTFNAVVLGGWDELLLDNPDAYKKIAEYIGPDVVEAFRKEMTPNAWKDFLAQAEWDGLSVEEAIAKAEVNNTLLTAKIKGAGTSSSYFSLRNLYTEAEESIATDTWAKNKAKWQAAYDKGESAIQKMMGWGDRAIDTVSDKVNYLHNLREEFLRKQVYRQNFMDALDRGKSLAQARNYAQYVMENATTNFSRGVAWGAQIVRSIPYFGAMLNGASSMVRLLEIDPLGVVSRFTTDLIIPTVGLTVLSLQNETDAEIYKNIPEWEKKGNLIWVVNGQVETVPLPEELAKFILPIRHAVELMHDANDNAWNELLVNDLLNMPTVPLNAIMMLDDKKINGDPTVADRLSALALDLFNTLAPNAARTAYIANTGRDPYTGKEYGKMKLFEDANGEYQYMSTTEYEFIQDLANVFKSWGWEISPLMAEGLLNSFFGTGSLDMAEGLRDFISSAQQGDAKFTALLEPSMERAGNVLTGTTRTDERQAEIAWYALLGETKNMKNELLSPTGKLAKYANDIDMASTAEEKQKKTELYNAEVRNYQNALMDKVKWYNSQYGDYFNRYKFASTLSYLTTSLSIDNIKDSTAYYNARAQAVETMYDAGFRSPNDNSIFGYAYKNPNTGEVSFKFTDPLVVTLNQNLLWYQGDTALRQIEETIEFSGLKDKYNNEFYPAYSAAMNKKDYATANKLAAEWDIEVIKEIMPIVDEYTVGELLKKSSVIDYLDNYIKVPSTTDAMGKGKYYSSSTGLNKQRGYAGSYIQKIYSRLKEKK